MPNTRYRLRSELPNLVVLKSLLAKIASNYSQGPSTRVVFEKGNERHNAADCLGVVIDGTAGSNNIQFRPGAVPVKATLTLQGMTFTADATGSAGNAITIALTTGATAGSEVVTVVGSAISVQISTGVSTRTQVKTALDNSVAAAALIDTSVTSGSTAATAPVTATHLAGGVTGAALERYDLADIENIRRLRTKKHLIVIKAGANPA